MDNAHQYYDNVGIAYAKNTVNLLKVSSEQLSVKYVGETPHQLVEGVEWRLFIPHHPPWLTDN